MECARSFNLMQEMGEKEVRFMIQILFVRSKVLYSGNGKKKQMRKGKESFVEKRRCWTEGKFEEWPHLLLKLIIKSESGDGKGHLYSTFLPR